MGQNSSSHFNCLASLVFWRIMTTLQILYWIIPEVCIENKFFIRSLAFKIFRMLSEGILNPTLCIILLLAFLQAPRTSRASLGKASVRAPNLSAQQTLSSHWHSIISSLSTLLTTMRANHVCVSLALILFCTPFRIIPLRECTKKFMIWWISMSEHEHRVIVGHLPYCLITAMDKYWGDWISVYYAIVQCTVYKFVWFSVYLLPSILWCYEAQICTWELWQFWL